MGEVVSADSASVGILVKSKAGPGDAAGPTNKNEFRKNWSGCEALEEKELEPFPSGEGEKSNHISEEKPLSLASI